MQLRCLDTLSPGQSAIVAKLSAAGPLRRRLLDMGLTEGSPVTCVGQSPGGDPMAYRVRGAVLALRRADSRTVLVKGV